MGWTLYLTCSKGGLKGYAYVMVASVIQLVALVWYLVSFLPGGTMGLRLVANPNDDFPAEYLEKAKKKEQQPLPQPLAGQSQPDFVVQQQQQRRKQDFVFYE